mgnify:CR=1 FL=1
MKKFFFLCVIITGSFLNVTGQEIPSEITDAFRVGDAKVLATFFHDNLELKIIDKSYISSDKQAERILEKFFKEHPPTSFVVNFNATRQGSKHGLGSLITEKGSFRVNIYFLDNSPDQKIYLLSIEKES